MDFDDNFKGDRPREQFSSAASISSQRTAHKGKDKEIADPRPVEELAAALMQQMTQQWWLNQQTRNPQGQQHLYPRRDLVWCAICRMNHTSTGLQT